MAVWRQMKGNNIALKFETFIIFFFLIFGGPCNSLVQKMYYFGARPIWVMGGQTEDKQGCCRWRPWSLQGK